MYASFFSLGWGECPLLRLSKHTYLEGIRKGDISSVNIVVLVVMLVLVKIVIVVIFLLFVHCWKLEPISIACAQPILLRSRIVISWTFF